ncbi:MAG: hypothetical protein Q9223_000586 [Gallowayella weberi]
MVMYNSERIQTAFDMLDKKHGSSEDYVTRYVMLIISEFFSYSIWSMVPQFLTENKKMPDLVLERYRTRSSGKKTFVPTVYFEFKSLINKSPKEAILQLRDSMHMHHGKEYPNKGYLIGIKGRQWLFMEYNMLDVRGQTDIYWFPFNGHAGYSDKQKEQMANKKRPYFVPNKKANPFTGEGYELDASKDQEDIAKILQWIANGEKPRDLSGVHNIPKGSLANSVTTSTMSQFSIRSEEGHDKGHEKGKRNYTSDSDTGPYSDSEKEKGKGKEKRFSDESFRANFVAGQKFLSGQK